GPIPAGVAPQKVVPISVFVSRKLSKLLVRQGFTPLFDIPVKIQNPKQPLGTHVFTAIDYRTPVHLFAGPSCHCRRNFLPHGAQSRYGTDRRHPSIAGGTW